MTDIFATFEPTSPPVANGPGANVDKEPGKRNRRTRAAAEAPAPKAKRPGRPRKVPVTAVDVGSPSPAKRARKAAAPVVKGDVTANAILLAAGLKADEAQLLSRMVTALQATKAGSRDRIVGALGKIFG